MAAKTITLRRTTSVPDLSGFAAAPVQCSPSFQDELRVYQETVCSPLLSSFLHNNVAVFSFALCSFLCHHDHHQNFLANALCGMHIEEGPTGAQCFGTSHSDLSTSAIQPQSTGSLASSGSSLAESPYVVGTPLPAGTALAPHVRLPCNPFLPPFAC